MLRYLYYIYSIYVFMCLKCECRATIRVNIIIVLRNHHSARRFTIIVISICSICSPADASRNQGTQGKKKENRSILFSPTLLLSFHILT